MKLCEMKKRWFRGFPIPIIALLFLSLGASSGFAQQDLSPKLTLELNRLQTAETGCRISFVARNDLGQPIQALGFEFAFFGKEGLLEKLGVLDFGALPQNKSRVLQFTLGELKCTDLTRLLINDAASCDGAPEGMCIDRLELKNRTSIEFGI